MDYKDLLFLAAAYSAGLATQRVLRAARDVFRLLAGVLRDVEEFELRLKLRPRRRSDDDDDRRPPRLPRKGV
ncbi:MAG TPA: hypothetical protein VF668_07055 [Pyrinomonadaceae bacterium]|jgi:hypothetical protein